MQKLEIPIICNVLEHNLGIIYISWLMKEITYIHESVFIHKLLETKYKLDCLLFSLCLLSDTHKRSRPHTTPKASCSYIQFKDKIPKYFFSTLQDTFLLLTALLIYTLPLPPCLMTAITKTPTIPPPNPWKGTLKGKMKLS